MANISLQGSIRTCKVDPGWASRVESDRFLNPELALCPVWNGVDNLGRPVNPFSFYTKNAGCNSSSDLVTIENDQRPRYLEYVTLDARGYLNESGSMLPDKETVRSAAIGDLSKITGNPGYGYGASVYPGCAYGDGVGMNNYAQRVNNMAAAGMQTQRNKQAAGLAGKPPVRYNNMMQQQRMQSGNTQNGTCNGGVVEQQRMQSGNTPGTCNGGVVEQQRMRMQSGNTQNGSCNGGVAQRR